MPRTVLEGMSMSKPIITTDTAGCRQTVEDGVTGYLVEVKSSKDLAEKIQTFLELSHDEVHTMGEAGRERVLKLFNTQKIADDLFEIIITG